MNWTGRKVLITGADGFIGSHLAEALVMAGADVTALAFYNSFDSFGWLDDVELRMRAEMRLARGDIRDGHQMVALCRGQEAVFHLAALISIPHSYDTPSSYVQTNVQGTVNILTASLVAGVSYVIHTSTSEVYGSARTVPIDEDHPMQAQSPYAASKIGADMMAESFACSFGLPVVTLRPFNTYGPRQSERAVIATIVRQALDRKCSDIRVGSLEPKRDFNFVSDTVSAFLRVASLAERSPGAVFNAGSGRMVAISEIVEEIRRVTGCDKPVIHEEQRKRPADSEVMTLMANAERLEKQAGWHPTVSLEDGLTRTIDWWCKRPGRMRPDASYMV